MTKRELFKAWVIANRMEQFDSDFASGRTLDEYLDEYSYKEDLMYDLALFMDAPNSLLEKL